MSEFVEVYIASDITFAYLVKAQLENAEIPVQIANENLGGAYCLDGMVPRVLVPAPYADQARDIIEEMRSSSPDEPDDLDDLEQGES